MVVDAASSNTAWWHRWKSWIKFVVTFVCIAAVVAHFIAHKADLYKLQNLSMIHISVIALLQLAYQLLFTSRSLIVFRKCSSGKITWFQWFRLSATARFLSLFVPQMGNVYQGINLKRIHQVSYTEYAASKFSLAWIDLIFNMFFASGVIVSVNYSFPIFTIPSPIFLAAFAIFAAAALPSVLFILKSLRTGNRIIGWLKSHIEEILVMTMQSIRDIPYLIKVVLLGVLIFSITCGVIYTCFHGLGAQPSLGAVVLFCILLKISDHAAITPGNLGIREILFGVLGQYFGLGVSEGILVSVIRRFISQVEIAFIAGLVNLPALIRKKGDQRRLI
jgi:uncharacterized membrane protein YbhN (UPF0104 family)